MLQHDLGLDVFATKLIYKDLITGKIVNRYEIIEGELQLSPKFRVLVDDIDKYRYLFGLLGFDIRSIGEDAFFLTRNDRSEEYNEVAADIQVLLIVIVRGVYSLGISPGIVLDALAGLTAAQINQIGELEEQSQILKACGLRTPLAESVSGKLVNRGVFFKTKEERYILSAAGKYLYNELARAE